MASDAPNIRVLVRLPWNRPETPLEDPPHIKWTSDKADILWKAIEQSRTSGNRGTDWKALAMRLDVPLPYLLYRVHLRFTQELKGIKDLQGALGPAETSSETPFPPSIPPRTISQLGGSTRVSSSSRTSTPTRVRERLNSLGHNSPWARNLSSSVATLQDIARPHHHALAHSALSVHSSDDELPDSDDEHAAREEESDRHAEEQEALDRKLRDLQEMVSNDALGFISHPAQTNHKQQRSLTRSRDGMERGTTSMISAPSVSGRSAPSVSGRSASHSLSSLGSPQDSVPDMPSPSPGSTSRYSFDRRMSPSKSASPPALSPRSAVGHRYNQLVTRSLSEQSSTHATSSEASSFSDIGSDASFSPSALESALMSNAHASRSRL
ncbi:hypothetical protein FISHEDRAFT_65326 [Fistulina hepatica ATCC 64428]|nr:hypothetical protein FISHEDRAFT_65326 [Fistulina hepatica ATCC 64428]